MFRWNIQTKFNQVILINHTWIIGIKIYHSDFEMIYQTVGVCTRMILDLTFLIFFSEGVFKVSHQRYNSDEIM